MPFSVSFTVDEDKIDGIQAGDLSVRYHSPSDAAQPLGHWSYQGRFEASAEEALAEVCNQFEAWRARRQVEVEIEATLRAALAPLCPCHEPESEESDDGEPEE